MANMGIKGWEPIYCDSADPAKIEDLYRAGFNAKPADKDVKAGIDFVLKRKPFIRTHPSNHNLNSEATAYRWGAGQEQTTAGQAGRSTTTLWTRSATASIRSTRLRHRAGGHFGYRYIPLN